MAVALTFRSISRQFVNKNVQRSFISAQSWNEKNGKTAASPAAASFGTSAQQVKPFCPYTPVKPAQREKSPFWIYAWGVSNGFSLMHRATGVAMTGLTLGLGVTYLFADNLTTYAAAFAALPWIIKFPIKAAWILPFSYHFMNGLRHLDWDYNKTSLQVKNLYVTARWGVFLSGAAALYFLGSAMFSDDDSSKGKKH